MTIGSALVTMPKILLLDEPTSGLYSRTSREVMSASECFRDFCDYDTDLSSKVRTYARRHGVIVIASIHQPNWETFALFDKLLLLAQGRTMFYGPIRKYLHFSALYDF